MPPTFKRVSAIAVAASLITTLVGADGSGALAQEPVSSAVLSEPTPQFIAEPVVQPLPAPSAAEAERATPIAADSLGELVSGQAQPAELSRELHCLAGAIYFEARGESLAGQLAVGRVIVARSTSGRFPNSYCGVVFQRSQFSFVRGQSMPGVNRQSRDWREAVAIAQIADAGSWRSPVEGALFFHASHVAPRWSRTRVGKVENHVFYR